jgi:hypothetical protein
MPRVRGVHVGDGGWNVIRDKRIFDISENGAIKYGSPWVNWVCLRSKRN